MAAPEADSGAATARFHRLLVAIDGSEHSTLALAEAIALAQRDNATLTLLSVAPPIHTSVPMGYVSVPTLQAEVDEEFQDILRAAVAAVPGDVSVTEVFQRGHPAAVILATIREGDYDAVMLGSRGLGRIAGILGSVSQEVLHHAEIAVLVAHAPPPESNEDRPGSPPAEGREDVAPTSPTPTTTAAR